MTLSSIFNNHHLFEWRHTTNILQSGEQERQDQSGLLLWLFCSRIMVMTVSKIDAYTNFST
jgi:hypothetical protein